MAPRTITERAAAGEILNARDLTREEQVELLIWARQRQPAMTYQEIIRRYGFTQSEGLLRTWYMVRTNNNPPRVATFTAEDVSSFKLCPETIHYYKYPLSLPLPFTLPFTCKQGAANTKPYGIGRASPTSGRTLRNRPPRPREQPQGNLALGPQLHPQERSRDHRRGPEVEAALGADWQPGRHRPGWQGQGPSCQFVPGSQGWCAEPANYFCSDFRQPGRNV